MKGPNWGLLNAERFRWMEEKRIKYLMGLTVEKSVEVFESLTLLEITDEFKNESLLDAPVCLKMALKKSRK